MYYQHPEMEARRASQRYAEILAEVAQERLARRAQSNNETLAHRVARVLGRALVQAGALMMRYGRSKELIVLSPGEARQPQLN